MLPVAMRTLTVPNDFDAVLVSFHAFATWVRRSRDLPSAGYCYTPPRFLYRPHSMRDERSASVRAALKLAAPVRELDRRYFRGVDQWASISTVVAQRVKDAYGLVTQVIHPPVDTRRFAAAAVAASRGDYALYVGRLVPYKNVDRLVAAFANLSVELRVIGGGRLRDELQAVATPNVKFLGRLTDKEVAEQVADARCVVMPQEEDFGIVGVEAMAAGVPVVALRAGGALDYIVDGVTGRFFDSPRPDAIAEAVRQTVAIEWDCATLRSHAERFGVENFQRSIAAFVEETIEYANKRR